MGLTLECKIHSWLQEIDPKFRATDFYQEQDPFRQNFTDRHLCYANESTPAKSHDLMERLPGNLRPELTPDPFASSTSPVARVYPESRQWFWPLLKINDVSC